MGGNNKQSQRTKNNAKPSNSGRSADYISNNMALFSGFSGMKETGFVFPLMSSEDMELGIDTDFQLVFKKMNKKDNTTKIKALQEFADLVKKSNPEVVKAVLRCWPRLYNSLTTDSEHKVREATHVAHNEVVKKVKRNLAPYLKSLIAAWFTSQYDTYPPAASASRTSFKNAFSEKNIEDVVAFCNQEILDYIYDNLCMQTTETVSNPKQFSSEEMLAKYERVLISSLLGYSLYFKKVPKAKMEDSIELNKRIINNNKFWKYSKHNLIIVRAAWFEVLTAVFEKAPFLLEKEEERVVFHTLGSIDETDPVVLPLIWQNVLLTITSIKEWWTKVNIDKLVLPKLWKVLKDGGQGNAAVIFPNLLPLLSNMIDVVDVHILYNNFFKNLCLGLKQNSVIASKSESTAVSTSLIECLRYAIMKSESNIPLCEELIKSYLISTIHWCFTESEAGYKAIFNQTASLAQYWSRNNASDDSKYFRYLTYFWSSITSLFEGVLMDLEATNSENISGVSERQVEFLRTMNHIAKVKNSLKVTFDCNEEQTGRIYVRSSSDQLNEFYVNGLTKVVLRVCEVYVKLIDEKKRSELFDHVSILINEFDSNSFFYHMTREIAKNHEDGIMFFFEKLLNKWLECEDLRCKSLIHIIFLTFKNLEDDGKEKILDSLNKVVDEKCLGWCLEEALSHKYNKNPSIRKWLISSKVTDFLVNIVEKEISDCCPPNMSALLKLAITGHKEELYVSQDAISRIVEKLRKTLLNPSDYLQTIDTCTRLAAYLSAIIYTKNYLLTFTDELLMSLLSVSCNTSIDTDYLSTATIWEAQTAWQDALTLLSISLPRADLEATLDKVVSFFHHQSLEKDNLKDKELERIIRVLENLCSAMYLASSPELNNILCKLFNHSSIVNERNLITNLCKSTEYLSGKLGCCYEEFKSENDIKIDSQELLHYFTWMYVKSRVLMLNLEEESTDLYYSYNENVEGECSIIIDVLSILDSKIDWISEILYDAELGKCFLENFETMKFSLKIRELSNKILSNCAYLIKNLMEGDINSMKSALQTKAHSICWIWARTYYTVHIDLLNEDPIKVYDDLLKDATIDDKLVVIQSTQVFSKHLDYDYVTHTFDDISRIIILRCLARCQGIDVQIAEVMSILEKIRNDTEIFKFESFNMDWQSYQIILETVRLFNELIKYQFDNLSRRQVDVIIISLTEWLPKITQFYKSEKVKPMVLAVTSLYKTINSKVKELKEVGSMSSLTKEWDDLFSEILQNDFVQLWLNLAGHLKQLQRSHSLDELPVMYSFTSMADCFDYQLIFRKSEANPVKWSKLLKESCTLLTSTSTTLQLSGYKTISSLIPGLVNIDSEAVDTNTPNKDGLVFELFKEICLSMQDIISTMLIDLKLGEDSCRVEPFTDSYNFTLAYLLIWDIMLSLCEKASTALKFQYADWLRQEDILKSLLDNLFRLMPIEIFQHTESKKLYNAEWFSSRVELNAEKLCTSAELEHMVCWIYHLALSQLPALVRQWWISVETRIAQIVDRITSAYVSPLLCNRELMDITQHENKFRNMTVKVLPTIREVVAIYTVDDSQMELIITLPTNYPLVGPDVKCNRQIGGTSHKQWLMQFKKCVLHQNGRIWDGLSLWNNNLDKKFDGVEECYICFAVLHPGTYQIPKLSCQTCRKKFHSACLYKWFSTSNKSSCPICRNLF